MKRSIQVFATLTIVLLLLGCFGRSPLKTLDYPAPQTPSATKLIIFLRGLGGNHHDFEQEGFVRAVQQQNLPFDMVAPNAHFGYYFAQTITTRLKDDIITPAQLNGYDHIWLVGISMGGLGSLMYAKDYPDEIDGIYLIAPFLGYDEIIEEIIAAGGLQKWQPGSYDSKKDWQRMFWHWLKQGFAAEIKMPPLYLGFGTEDRFNKAHQLLSTMLPREHLFVLSGGHDKKTMKKLWLLFLDSKTLN